MRYDTDDIDLIIDEMEENFISDLVKLDGIERRVIYKYREIYNELPVKSVFTKSIDDINAVSDEEIDRRLKMIERLLKIERINGLRKSNKTR